MATITKNIKQSIRVHASPAEVYKVLMTSSLHSKLTGDKAIISQKIGGHFSAFGGYASGENLELVPNKKIVQTWYASDWPKGHLSTLTIRLSPMKGGTKLLMFHSNVPAAHAKSIADGWQTYYWKPLVQMFAE